MTRWPALLLTTVLAAPAPAQQALLPDAERIVLDNGAVLVLVEKPEVPLVAFQALLAGGAVADPPDKSGTASLLANLLTKGAGERDSAAFAEAVEAAGGTLHAEAALESIAVSGEFLARDADLAIELLADVLRRPRLDLAELARLRSREINLLRAAKDSDPGDLMPLYANAFVYGEHPYGNPVAGSEASLAAITHGDVVDYYAAQVGADRLIVVIAGDFAAPAMAERLRTTLAGWRPANAGLAPVPAPQPVPGGRVLLIDKPGATQSYFWIGGLGVDRAYARRAELELANTLFGDRFTSMLNTALRVESGLTYGASSELVRPRQTGTVAIRSYTRTEATVEAIDMAVNLLGRLHDRTFEPDMLLSAQNYLLGQFPTSLETAAQLATQFAVLEFYGLGRDSVDGYGDAVRNVTPDALRPVIDEVYPRRDELVYVLLGDAAIIRDSVRKYGAVTEMPIAAPHFHVPADAGTQSQ